MPVFTCWTHGPEEGVTICAGKKPPRGVNGRYISRVNVKEYVIEAGTWEAAMAEHHARQGWEAYRPMGEE